MQTHLVIVLRRRRQGTKISQNEQRSHEKKAAGPHPRTHSYLHNRARGMTTKRKNAASTSMPEPHSIVRGKKNNRDIQNIPQQLMYCASKRCGTGHGRRQKMAGMAASGKQRRRVPRALSTDMGPSNTICTYEVIRAHRLVPGVGSRASSICKWRIWHKVTYSMFA